MKLLVKVDSPLLPVTDDGLQTFKGLSLGERDFDCTQECSSGFRAKGKNKGDRRS